MTSRLYTTGSAVILMMLVACARSRPPAGPPTPPVLSAERAAEARTLFYDYETALRAGQRNRLVSFYAPSGAVIVFNGQRSFRTPAQIDSLYRGSAWQPPVFFAFDNLAYDALSGGDVLVTGRFRWLRAQSADTLRLTYLAVLRQTPAGLRISVEHETQVAR
jgi:ketosteroid isomerase-like protein